MTPGSVVWLNHADAPVRVLGPLEVVVDGKRVDIRPGGMRRLILALLLRANQTVLAEALSEHLWGRAQPSNPANALQTLVSRVRKAIDGGPLRIETVDQGYRLVVHRSDVDVFVFEDEVRSLGALDPVLRLQAADAALGRWRGSPLADAAYESFAQSEIRRLSELRLAALEARVEALLELGRHTDAVSELAGLVTEHPLHERFHAQLMVALYRSGRQADALRAYDAAREALVDEMGLDPGPELRGLAAAVLDQSSSLDWVPAVAPGAASPAPAPGGAAVAPRLASHARRVLPRPPGAVAAVVTAHAVPRSA